MCYDDNARPPEAPGPYRVAQGTDLVLTAQDGNQFAAFYARSNQPSTAQVLIYPDVRGLHQFYKELALRFAEIGFDALAIDYFGRTAGLTSRDEPFDFWPHVQQMHFPSFTADVEAAVAHLRTNGSGETAIFVVGFCMGGSLAFQTGRNASLGFAGLVPFYAGLSRDMGMGSVLANAAQVTFPVLALFGGDDPGIPQADIDQLDGELDKAGVPHDIVVYPDAPHSFFDRRATDFAEASQDAWQRVIKFISEQTAAAK